LFIVTSSWYQWSSTWKLNGVEHNRHGSSTERFTEGRASALPFCHMTLQLLKTFNTTNLPHSVLCGYHYREEFFSSQTSCR